MTGHRSDSHQINTLVIGMHQRGIRGTAAGTPAVEAPARAALDAIDALREQLAASRAEAAEVRRATLRGFTLGVRRRPRWRAAAPR